VNGTQRDHFQDQHVESTLEQIRFFLFHMNA
jgi:hypothetical protein